MIPATLLGTFPGIFSEQHISKTQREKFIKQNQQAFDDFANALSAQTKRATEMLDETVKSCNLEEVSLSRCFKQALARSEPLRERFADAAADTAKQAREAKAAPQKNPAPAKKTPTKKAAAKANSYDRLKIV